MPKFEKHILICTNERDKSASRPACRNEGSKKLKDEFKDELKRAGVKHRVRTSETGCLDQCEHAPVVVVYPDATWYGFVHRDDVREIVEQHVVGGRPVERLELPDTCINTDKCPHRGK